MKHKTPLTLIVCSILVALLAACATSQPTATAVPTAMPVTRTTAPTATSVPATATALPTPGAATADFPTGVFANGSRSWEFRTDGTAFWSAPTVSDGGPYKVTGDQIVLKSGYCGDVEGLYTWAYDGTVLSFKVLRDRCFDRRAEVDLTKWKRKP